MPMWIDTPDDLHVYATDFGNVVHDTPRFAALPSTTVELQQVIQNARRSGFSVTPRGAAHSTNGQAQSRGGVLLDMSRMTTMQKPKKDSVWVGAGLSWRSLLAHTLPHGLTFPIFTDYIDATIGGTISVGGVGSQTFRFGTQTDNVLALEVVTGTGEIIECSPSQNAELFDLVRGGLGQFAVIANAQLRLIPAPTSVRFHRLFFGDLDLFLNMLNGLIDTDTFGGVEGFALPGQDHDYLTSLLAGQFPNEITGTPPEAFFKNIPTDQTWIYMIEIADYAPLPIYRPLAADFADLGLLPNGQFAWNVSYSDYISRLTGQMNFLKQIGVWDLPHPWINIMVNDTDAPAMISTTLAETNPADSGAVLIYPYRRDRLKTPLFRIPEKPSEHVIKFAYLRSARDLPHAQAMISHNRRIWERTMSYGGTRYPVDSVPMEEGEWARQFGAAWSTVVAAKRRYDPDSLLAPSQRIFG